jgi:tetratricopeptide (TPR) repeat protein
MLSWGWFLAFVGLIFLWLSSKIIYFSDRKVRLIGVSLFLLMTCLLIFLIKDSIRANNFHKSGDTKLASGSLIDAVDLYNKSIKLDKTLQFSKPFLTKVSKALYLIHGNKYPWAQFYIAVQIEGNRNKDQKTVDRVSINRNVRLLLNDTLNSKPDSIFERSIYDLSRELTTDSWVEEGHLAYSQGHVETALQAYLNADLTDRSDVRFFIGYVYKHLHKFNQSILINVELLQKIHNPFIRSMLACSLGDTYQEAGNLNLARQAYFDCMDFDPISNYHAAKSLSGT